MSHISRQDRKELNNDLKTLTEYPIMKPKGAEITPVAKFLTHFVEAGSLEELEKRTPPNDISFEYYMKWADGFRAIDRELNKNKQLKEKINKAPQDITQYLDCVSLTLRLTKKAEDLGKYVPGTQKWKQVCVEYRELYQKIVETDPDYAHIFVEDIAKPVYVKTQEVLILAAWGHYQALNYLAQYYYQKHKLSLLDPKATSHHFDKLQRPLEQASAQGSNHATQTIGALCVSGFTREKTRLDTFQKFRVNYEIAARRGNPAAMVGLGFSLLQSEEVFDPKTGKMSRTMPKIDFAIQFLSHAAKQDCTMAHVHLAGFYYTNKMIDRAIEHYKAAIENEHIPSMLFLARIYMEMSQQGNDKTEEIIKYFKMAMAAGNLEARFHLATVYSNTVEWLSKHRNHTLAFAHAYSSVHLKFEDVSDKDQRQFITFSKILVGDFYRDGTTPDGQKDIPKAIEYYEMGIADFKQYPDVFTEQPTEIKLAFYQLGYIYYGQSKDEHSPEKLSKSLDYFKEAALLGHLPSMQFQTRIYEEGITQCTEENANIRIRLHQTIAAQALIEGNIEAMMTAQKMQIILYESSTLNPKPNYEAAIKICNLLFNNYHDTESAFILGKMYEEGKTGSGTPNIKEAIKYYTLCAKADRSPDKKYTILAYHSLGEMAFDGRSFGKPNYRMALNYYDKIRALGDPQAYVLIGFLNLGDTDPTMPPNLSHAMANFRKAKQLGFAFTPDDLNEISNNLNKFSESHKEDYIKAVYYDLQLLLNDQFIDKLLNELTTDVPALLVYPPYLLSDTLLQEESRLSQINQYLAKLIEIATAYHSTPISEGNIEIMIRINTAIESCARVLNLQMVQYVAYKNLARLHFLNPTPNYPEVKKILNLLIYQFDDPESAYVLGRMEENGQNETGEPDYKAAQRAYALGARDIKNNFHVVNCLIALGNMAYLGNGYPDDKPYLKDALKHYTTVAHLGYNHAYILMGLTHLSQSDPDFSPNIAKAMSAFRIAEDKGMDFPADLIEKIKQNLEALKQSDAEAYTKAVHYDLPFLQNYSWIADKFFTPGCKVTDDEKSMIPKYMQWTREDICLDETDRKNILEGFQSYYKAYV